MNSSFLDAFAELNQAGDAAADMVLDLDIDTVDPDPNQPRKQFDESEELAMAETFRTKGQLQPIKVRRGGEGRWIIVFGERRWRAARRAGLRRIRALEHRGPIDELSLLEEQVLENDQRAGLNTAEMAGVVARMLAMGENQAGIAKRLGRGKDQIALLAAVPRMPTALQALAPHLGARTLHELNSAHKVNPGEVGAWLKDRDPASITQSAARALAARYAEDDRDAVIEGRRAKPGAPRKREAPTPVAAPAELVVQVEVDGRPGRLLLQAAVGDEAFVRFDGRGRAERVPLASIRLTGLRAD